MPVKTVRSVLAQMSKDATLVTEKKIGFIRFHSNMEKEKSRIVKEKERVLKNLTPMEREMTQFLSKNPFGCNNDKVIQLESIRAGKKLPAGELEDAIEEDDDDGDDDESNLGPKFKERDIQFLTMFVPLRQCEDHNYPIGEPCLSVDREGDALECLLRLENGEGNTFENRVGIMRTALPEEIDRFFNTISSRDLRDALEYEVPTIETVLGKKLGAPKGGKKKAPAKKAAKKKKPLKKKRPRR